ncbi:CPBP family intramembrane glutamic endopeptidase [Qipengyuania aquimaris]|uniref:CPBP family intramembrane glutamic endopeptidase n=1 Tax=Qipengyuania aquimaris TaxID=255984 RepID=UPI0028F3E87C|nr:CPBP family intramembrane glutamic endopeptidase [Qipengyuania aquimaris]
MTDNAVTQETGEKPLEISDAKPLGWGRFVLQFVTIAFVYFAAQFPPVLIWGYTNEQGVFTISSTGAAVSTALGMAAALLVAWMWLRKDGALSEAWNLKAPASWTRTLLIAAGATIAIIIWFTVGSMMLSALGLETPDVGEVLGWVTESPFHFVLWILLVAVFAAGFGEELLWRGFLMDRLSRLGGLRGSMWLIILIQAALFGLPHLYQGLGGVIITGVVGIGFGWLRYRCGGNLWACIIAHVAVDVIMMSLSYAGKLGIVPT